jgi:hypothetical protein
MVSSFCCTNGFKAPVLIKKFDKDKDSATDNVVQEVCKIILELVEPRRLLIFVRLTFGEECEQHS